MRLSVLSIIRIGVVVAFFFAYPAKPEKLFIRATVDVMCVRFSICLLFCLSSRCELSRIRTRSKIQRQERKKMQRCYEQQAGNTLHIQSNI